MCLLMKKFQFIPIYFKNIKEAFLDGCFDYFKAFLVVFGTCIRVPLRYGILMNEDYIFFSNSKKKRGILIGASRDIGHRPTIILSTKAGLYPFVRKYLRKELIQIIEHEALTDFLLGLACSKDLPEEFIQSYSTHSYSNYGHSKIDGECYDVIAKLFAKRRRHLYWYDVMRDLKAERETVQELYDKYFENLEDSERAVVEV